MEATEFYHLPFKRMLYFRLVKAVTTCFLPVSNAVNRQYQHFFPSLANRFFLLHNGAEVNKFNKKEVRTKFGIETDKIWVATVAFAMRIKGIDILIDAIAILKNDYSRKDFVFVIIGLDETDALTRKLHQQAEKLGVAEQIQWFGIVDNVPELLTAMDIYCQPSRSESLSVAIIEAGMAGVPAVGANVGGIKEVILDGSTGFLFRREDARNCAEKINMLLDDHAMRKAMGANAKQHMLQHFELNKQIDKLTRLYHDTLTL